MSHRNQSEALQTIHLSLSFFRSTGGLSQDTGPRIFTHQQVNDRSPILPMRVPSLLSLNPCETSSPRKRKKRTESPFHISSFILILEYTATIVKRAAKDNAQNEGSIMRKVEEVESRSERGK